MRGTRMHLRCASRLGMLLVLSVASPAYPASHNRTVQTIPINASTPSQIPHPSSYIGGTAVSPQGHRLGLNSMYLTRDGAPWLPVMGEFHFSRVPEDQWQEELLKMRAAGVQIVATYVFWIHHEEIEEQFDWYGQRDLRKFIELCARTKMDVIVRVGPWAHGEARNGGLPDWLLKKGPTRSADPVYMNYVSRYFEQIAKQLNGLLWKDGGPVIGIQLENEFSGRGPKQGEEYILALKRLALAKGLDVPFYTVTGWDNAVVPAGQVLPVFGGYPDAPWDASLTKLPPNEVYMFRLANRVAGNMGAPNPASAESSATDSSTPFITAEMGGGNQDTYHRRPVIKPDDIAAMVPVMLGSGVNLYGTYMFQGGENPDGQLSTLQESQATGYPTDVPIKSYDFQAPLGAFGQERESFRKLKVFQYFLNDFGTDLAPMSGHSPAALPAGPADFIPIRAAIRSTGDRGFLFVNNYVRGATMPDRKAVQFDIRLPDSSLRIPAAPVDIPSNTYFIWPFNLDLGIATLRYSTAQLFTRLRSEGSETYFFEQIPGIPAEMVFKDEADLHFEAPGAVVHKQNGLVEFSHIPEGLGHRISVRRGSGPETRIVLLTQNQAEHAWKATLDGSQYLIETEQDFYPQDSAFVLQSLGSPRCAFHIYPEFHGRLAGQGFNLQSSPHNGVVDYSGSVPAAHVTLSAAKINDAGEAQTVKLGPPLNWRPQGVAMAPSEEAFARAAAWDLTVSGEIDRLDVGNLFLEVQYTGDEARLQAGPQLLDDNFYNGTAWSIGLRQFEADLRKGPLVLRLLPLRKDAPVYLEQDFRPEFGDKSQAIELKNITITPQYQFTIGTSAPQ